MVAKLNSGTDGASGESTRQTGIITEHPIQDEESPLLSPPNTPEGKVKALTGVGTIIAVLLLGKIWQIPLGNHSHHRDRRISF